MRSHVAKTEKIFRESTHRHTSKFVFDLAFRPLSQGLPQRIWEAISGSTAKGRNVSSITNLLVSVSAFSEVFSQRDAFQGKRSVYHLSLFLAFQGKRSVYHLSLFLAFQGKRSVYHLSLFLAFQGKRSVYHLSLFLAFQGKRSVYHLSLFLSKQKVLYLPYLDSQ